MNFKNAANVILKTEQNSTFSVVKYVMFTPPNILYIGDDFNMHLSAVSHFFFIKSDLNSKSEPGKIWRCNSNVSEYSLDSITHISNNIHDKIYLFNQQP